MKSTLSCYFKSKSDESSKENCDKNSKETLFSDVALKRKCLLNSSTSTKRPKISEILAEKSVNSSINSEYSEIQSPNQSFIKNIDDKESETEYPHLSYEFLSPSQRKDKYGRSIHDPNFDSGTLLIPIGFLASKDITPAMKQWWKIKADNFDSVLFFKMGKFYELFHMDADIGVKELGLTYMKGKYAHAGFPETAISLNASTLIERGYKVARVEQTETPEDASIRRKEGGCQDKLVRRDICAIVSSSTRIFDSFDVEPNLLSDSTSSFGLLLCVVQDEQNPLFSFGVCILDASTANFTLYDYTDDSSLSNIFMLLANFSYPPAEIILSKGFYSDSTFRKLKGAFRSARFEISNFNCPPTTTFKELISGEYFKSNGKKSIENWPTVLSDLVKDDDFSGNLCLSAFGHIIKKLKRHLIDQRIISIGNFSYYNPDTYNKSQMVIDETALRSLDVVSSSSGSIGKEGTILGLVNHCGTSMGKRLMVNLVCHPLVKIDEINERLDAIDKILSLDTSTFIKLRNKLSNVPDLERIIFRLHSYSNVRSTEHIENKAVIFNESHFNKKKIDDLINFMVGMECALSFMEFLKSLQVKSTLISKLISFEANSSGILSSFEDALKFLEDFKRSFDFDDAQKRAVIIPRYGSIPEYDNFNIKIKEIQNELDEYLEGLKSEIKCKDMKYIFPERQRYLIEVPDSIKMSSLPTEFLLKSQRKGYKRYSTEDSQLLVSKLVKAEQARDNVLKSVLVLLINKLIVHKESLYILVKKLSYIDCLLSLSYFSAGYVVNGTLCRPEFVKDSSPFIEIEAGYHPCLSLVKSTIVSNNISIGTYLENNYRTLLITGPNMGGKSTLMRQTAIIVILAQVGCYVPSASCKLTPVDKIFARLGASFDHPSRGESTFYVEMNETSRIIKNATSNSLVLFDELGRGTATHDGLALAYSILKHITQNINCLCLFSTHYHYIAKEVSALNSLNVHMVFMECIVQEKSSESCENITFLYKVKNGICPKSYGFYVAKLAGIPQEVVDNARKRASTFQRNSIIEEIRHQKERPVPQVLRNLCLELSQLRCL